MTVDKIKGIVNHASPYQQAVVAAHMAYLRKCLEESGGNVTRAARIAGVNRTHFYQLCARYQIPSRHGRRPTSAFSNPLRRGKPFRREA